MKPKRALYGLLGYPLGHSLSPRMHNAGLRALKIKGEYRLFEVKPDRLNDFLLSAGEKHICGFNVTIPYKEAVIPYLSRKSGGVREIGAVNTVLVGPQGKLNGFNTDYLGFSQHLKILRLKPRRVALIGAGGASRAVCFALGKMNTQEVCVCDIDNYRSLSLIRQFKDIFPACRFTAVARIEELDIRGKDLLINASGVGMKAEDPCLIPEERMHKGLFVYDLVYNPLQTKLLAAAARSGLKTSNGLSMLLYQGVLSFSRFTGRKAPLETMRRALEKGAKKL